MMKTIIFFMLLAVSTNRAAAQTANKYFREIETNDLLIPLQAMYPNYQLDATDLESGLQKFLVEFLPGIARTDLKLLVKNENHDSKHFFYQQFYQDVAVYNSCVKVNLDRNNRVYSVYFALANFEKGYNDDDRSILPISDNVDHYQKVFIAQNDFISTAVLHSVRDAASAQCSESIIKNNSPIFTRDLNSYFAAHDTTIRGFIFEPDPLTSSYNVYGGALIDNNDNTSAFFDARRVDVSVAAIDSLNVFYLQNPYCVIVESNPPSVSPATSLIGQFYFNRFDDGFEDFNVFYHISFFRNYLNANLGFPIMYYPISCDAHGASGADNSFFTYSTSPPSLIFGEGGVDDAEDADVIIHEYCHAVSHDVAPLTNNGTERISVDEGFGDYMACSYSKSISPFHADSMFTWDGHNPFWPGRKVSDTKIYPTNINGDIYNNGGIWSSALWEIEQKIGREKTNKLAIQTMYDNAVNMTMRQVAVNFVMADTILYGGIDYCQYIHSFIARGLLDASFQRGCDFTSVLEDTRPNFALVNTQGFALGTSDLIIPNATAEAMQINLYDVQGSTVVNMKNSSPSNSISSYSLAAGLYILELRSNGKSKSYKLVKY